MIPMGLVLKIDSRPHRRIRLWIPLLLIGLILLPFALVPALVAALWCRRHGGDPVRIAAAALQLLGSARGTHVEIHNPRASFLIRIV
jgi:hypothetical protein